MGHKQYLKAQITNMRNKRRAISTDITDTLKKLIVNSIMFMD